MTDERDLNQEDALFSEANRWFFRLQAEDISDEEGRQFSEWVRTDPAHAKAWDEVRALMGALRRPAQEAHSGQRNVPQKRAAPTRSGTRNAAGWALGGVLAIALVAAATIQGPAFYERWIADYVTAPGQRETITLADGTKVELNTDTALKIAMSKETRRVTILRGEAFLEIARDARPFIVRAGDGETRDIGTAFDVANADRSVTVTVASGIVEVQPAATLGQAARLTAGETVGYDSRGISPVRQADLDSELAWRRGQIVFRQQKLSDVVAQLNRYRRGHIVIVNPWIADELVSGSFNIDRPDAPIEALEDVLGVRATSLTPWLVMLR